MKKLQNNFTTPEQSKRLLELGVPANSADMWWEKDETIRINGEWVHGAGWSKVPSPFNWDRDNNRFYTYSETKEATENFTGNDTLPCWSVGRLVAIYETCTACLFERRNPQLSVLEDVLSQIAEDIMATDECWDFSKLEE